MQEFELTPVQRAALLDYYLTGAGLEDISIKVISLLTDEQIKQLANERDMLVIHESDL